MFALYKIFKQQAREHRLKGMFRYFFRWKKSLHPDANSVKDEQPWITFPAIDFLSDKLEKEHRVFEYGGGGSTLFFVSRVGEVVTVEHSSEWFTILSDMIGKKNVKNWKGRHIAATRGVLTASPDPAEPEHYGSDDKPSEGFNYREYVSVIDQYPDQHFDWIIVDGRSRPACIVHATPKLKKGGYLVLDNSDREYYLKKTAHILTDQYETVIDSFGPSPYSRDFTKTSIWRKK